MKPLFHITNRMQLRRRIASARPSLYRLACSWCHDQHSAEDLVQETLLRAIQNLNQLRDVERLEVWLTRILANLYRDQLRRHRDEAALEENKLVDETCPERFLRRNNLIENVRDGIRQLREEQRMVLTLVDLMEFSYADVAQTLEIPTGTVMSRLCRARRNLKALLKESRRHEERPSTLRRVK